MRIKYDRHSAIDDPTAALGRMSMDLVGWGMTSIAKGVFHVGDLAAKNVHERNNKDRKQNLKENHFGSANLHPIQYDNISVSIQNNAIALMPPAPSSSIDIDFGFDLVGNFLKSGLVEDVKRTTLITVSWGLLHLANRIHRFGDRITNVAAEM